MPPLLAAVDLSPRGLAIGLGYYLVFLLSTTVHEAAHAFVAMRGGDLTAYHGGQVTLDPAPHIRREPVGMVVLPVISLLVAGWPFGFASAPYDPQWALAYPRRSALMALAGPVANLALVLLAGAALRVGLAVGVFAPVHAPGFDQVMTADAGVWHGAVFFLSVVFSLNLLLGVFNLLPLPPLDGSGVAPLFLSAETARRYQRWMWGNRQLAWIGIIVAWNLIDRVWPPVNLFVMNLLFVGTGTHYVPVGGG